MRRTASLGPVLLLVSAACTACGGGRESPYDEEWPADAGATTPDGGYTGPRRSGVIAPIKGAEPKIALMTLYDDGAVEDLGLRLPTGTDPRKAAVSPNGLEAAIIWAGGGPGTPKGVTFVTLNDDPAAEATVAFDLDLKIAQAGGAADYDQSPTDVTYVGPDEVLITVRGPDEDGVIPAYRDGASWSLGQLVVLDDGPLVINPIPETNDAVILTFPLSGPAKLITIRRGAGGTWARLGAAYDLDTSSLRLAVHASGQFAYASSYAPGTSMTPTGRLHLFGPGADGAWTQTALLTLSGAGSQISISPRGDFAVIPTVNQVATEYRLITLDLSSPGVPSEIGTYTTIPGFLMRDLEIGPDGQMFVSVDLPSGGGKVLSTMTQATPGMWQTVWGPEVQVAGVDDVALADVSFEVE